jgi:Co/Zn/Cd efflux system component
VPVVGAVAIVIGLLAAAAHWVVARLLLAPSRHNAAVRLAYIHNIGDVYVSLAPVGAGVLVSVTSYSIFDAVIAAGIAVWIIVTTAREVFASSEEFIWPEKIACGHSDHEEGLSSPLPAGGAPDARSPQRPRTKTR